jgi:hypothetical protein
LQLSKGGSTVKLRCKNPKLSMSQMGSHLRLSEPVLPTV